MQKAAVSKAKVDDAKASWESGIDLYHLIFYYTSISYCVMLYHIWLVLVLRHRQVPHIVSNLRIFVTSSAVRGP